MKNNRISGYSRGRVAVIYFSPNGTTGKWSMALAEGAARVRKQEIQAFDLTFCYKNPPAVGSFDCDDLLVIGMPVYVGYIPSVAASFLKTVRGDHTACILAVSYGNRDYGKSLYQLEHIMRGQGCIPVAAAAFSSRHCMAPQINSNHPDAMDLAEASKFGAESAERLERLGPEGAALKPGRIPEGKAMNREADLMAFPAERVMTSLGMLPREPPKAGPDCTGCGVCSRVCPTGAIDRYRNKAEPYMCLVCGACIHNCPQKALDFVQPEFIYIKKMCAEKFGSPRKECRYFSGE